MSARLFKVICEIEPPTRPDLKHVRHQIGVLSAVTDTFLIPDNHIGRATVSSIAVAHEVEAMGGSSIACINSRDRNLLGFRRDLLTAAAYGVDQFLFVHGDKPSVGDRASGLTVRTMIEEARTASEDPAFAAKLRAAGAQAQSAVYPGGHSLQTVSRHLDSMLLFAGRALSDAQRRAAVEEGGCGSGAQSTVPRRIGVTGCDPRQVQAAVGVLSHAAG